MGVPRHAAAAAAASSSSARSGALKRSLPAFIVVTCIIARCALAAASGRGRFDSPCRVRSTTIDWRASGRAAVHRLCRTVVALLSSIIAAINACIVAAAVNTRRRTHRRIDDKSTAILRSLAACLQESQRHPPYRWSSTPLLLLFMNETMLQSNVARSYTAARRFNDCNISIDNSVSVAVHRALK